MEYLENPDYFGTLHNEVLEDIIKNVNPYIHQNGHIKEAFEIAYSHISKTEYFKESGFSKRMASTLFTNSAFRSPIEDEIIWRYPEYKWMFYFLSLNDGQDLDETLNFLEKAKANAVKDFKSFKRPRPRLITDHITKLGAISVASSSAQLWYDYNKNNDNIFAKTGPEDIAKADLGGAVSGAIAGAPAGPAGAAVGLGFGSIGASWGAFVVTVATGSDKSS